MTWVTDLLREPSVAHDVLVLALVAVLGLAIGNIQWRGVGLGIAGVLFAGLAFGHFGFTASEETIELLRDFGLILFVYAVGMQVGPGFIDSLKQQGLVLNALAALLVISGALVTLLVAKLGAIPIPVAAGLFSGATTNTPSLAAAQGALKELPRGAVSSTLPGLGYAVSYPFGVLGIILTMVVSRAIFRVNLAREFEAIESQEKPTLQALNLEVQNTNLNGLTIREIPYIKDSGVVISRVKHNSSVEAARGDTRLQTGDVLLAVGEPDSLKDFERVIGPPSDVDLREIPADVTTRRMIVTNRATLGKTVHELKWEARYGVIVTRVIRAGLELAPRSDLRLQFGDEFICVGEENGLDQAGIEAGDSRKKLQHPNLLPVFLGIVLGVLLGSWAIPVPGMPAPLKLGLAGGPLLVALLLSNVRRIGPVVWYLPPPANTALREFGISLFLGAVGLKAGHAFVPAFTNGDGLHWMAWAALITIMPLILVTLMARLFAKMNFATLCGLLAGGMTDPPALAFATGMAKTDAPSISYAAVYPLVMILRIISAQLIILFFAR